MKLWCLILCVHLGGCAFFSEKHYFKVRGDASGRNANYFRVNVTGYSFMSKVRYLSGYFDEKAVDRYFSELKPPENYRLVDTPRPAVASGKPIPLSAAGNKSGVLVMILSTDPSSVANTIAAFVEQDKVQKALYGLMNRDRLMSLARREAHLTTNRTNAAAMVAKTERELATLGDSPTQSHLNAFVLSLLQDLADGVGNTTRFSKPSDAVRWLDASRARLGGLR